MQQIHGSDFHPYMREEDIDKLYQFQEFGTKF